MLGFARDGRCACPSPQSGSIDGSARAHAGQTLCLGPVMYRLRSAFYVDHMLGDIRGLRSRLDELHGLQVALGNNDLPWCTRRQKFAVLALIDCTREFPSRSELDDLLLLVAEDTVHLGRIAKALDCLEAVLIPRRIYRGKSKGALGL